MIVVQLMGGLGNQMFQYALGRRLAFERNVPLKLDISWFKIQDLREYQLDQFNIDAELASEDEVTQLLKKQQTNLYSKLFYEIQRLLPYYKRRFVSHTGNVFDPNILKAQRTVVLYGYWQSEKYFKSVESIIRKDFMLKQPLDYKMRLLKEKISTCNAVNLHVRRGDYINNPKTNKSHGVCELSYYEQAVINLGDVAKNAHFFVFSDDPEWASANLTFIKNATFIDRADLNQDVQHLYLMSLCKHHIIANSTFSWWGAWLAQFPQKKILAPLKWFNDETRDTSSLIPETWQRL